MLKRADVRAKRADKQAGGEEQDCLIVSDDVRAFENPTERHIVRRIDRQIDHQPMCKGRCRSIDGAKCWNILNFLPNRQSN